jgi:rhodanese-related sulfurtransferase
MAEPARMDIQRVRVKLFADAPPDLDVAPLLDIFARWRHDAAHPAGWIDLADYAHVPGGPAALLVGKLGNLGYDLADGRPGLVWRNKVGLAGGVEQRLSEAMHRGLEVIAALIEEPDFPAAVRLYTDRLAVDLVDRVAAPNTDETEAVVGPALSAALDRAYGAGQWRARRTADPGSAFGYEVQAHSAPSLDQLVRRLRAAPVPPEEEVVDDMAPSRVSAREAARLMAEEGYVYLDVRSLGEFAAGHPTGAYNVPIVIESPIGYGLVPNQEFLDVVRANFAPDAAIVVGCRTSGRSAHAQQVLAAHGYRNVVLNQGGFEAARGPGGMEPGWARCGLPVSVEPEPGRSYADLHERIG